MNRVKMCPKCEQPRKYFADQKRYVCVPCKYAYRRAWGKKKKAYIKAKGKAYRNTPAGREQYRRYGVSERNKALMRSPEGRARNRKHSAKNRAENPQKWAARNAVNVAIRRGKLKRPEECPRCGIRGKAADGRPLVQFHHTRGYGQKNWFVGEWCCTKCHGKEHRKYA